MHLMKKFIPFQENIPSGRVKSIKLFFELHMLIYDIQKERKVLVWQRLPITKNFE